MHLDENYVLVRYSVMKRFGTGTTAMVYSFIEGVISQGGTFEATNERMAEMLSCTKMSIKRTLRYLEKEGYIRRFTLDYDPQAKTKKRRIVLTKKKIKPFKM